MILVFLAIPFFAQIRILQLPSSELVILAKSTIIELETYHRDLNYLWPGNKSHACATTGISELT
jgi:hypothetical protein